jgi:hypothetical protein
MTKSKKSTSKVRVPGAKKTVSNMKYEIANEFGVNLGPEARSRDNGAVGGEMTKRLVEKGKKSPTNIKKSRKKSN